MLFNSLEFALFLPIVFLLYWFLTPSGTNGPRYSLFRYWHVSEQTALRIQNAFVLIASYVFYGWGGLIREMVTRGQIVCGTGTQKEYFIPKSVVWVDRDQARRVFLRRYFAHYGPATVSDCRYFFGNWKKKDMDPLLKELLPTLNCMEIGSKRYYSAREPVTEGDMPPCVLVPGFDQLVLGYRDRDRMIDARFLRELTNMAGIVFPSVLIRGRIQARWKLAGKQVIVTSFDRRLKKDEAAIRRKVKEVFGKQIKGVFFSEDEA